MGFENATAQSHEPMAVRTGIPDDKRKALADGLAKVLADTYTLLGKTHGFHWNVTGPQFHSLHEMFEEQYTDLTGAVDELAERIRALGGDPFDYEPVPGQIAMFNTFEGLEDTVERVAAFSLAGEGVADYLIERALDAPSVPEWLKAPYRAIHADEEEHGNYPAEVIARLATTEESQQRARRAVAMSLVLRRQYFADLDAAVLHGKTW